MDMKPSTPFNWRDYVVLHESLGKNKPLFEKALDDIAAATPDGPELILNAYRMVFSPDNLSKEKYLLMRTDGGIEALIMGTNPGSHIKREMKSHVHINLSQIRRLAFSTPEGPKQASLTGTIIHELFHVADINLLSSVRFSRQRYQEIVQRAVISDTLNAEDKERVLSAFNELRQDLFNKKLKEQSPIDINAAREAVQKYILQNAKQIRSNVAKQTHLAEDTFDLLELQQPGALEQYEKNKIEGDATRYTDVFMAKHFPSEPWRGQYENARLLEKPGEILVPLRECGVYRPGVYQADSISISNLGQMQQPIIAASPSPFCVTR